MASWYDLKGTLQKVFRIGNKNLTIDAQAPMAERTFYMPDSSVDLRNGVEGQVLSQTGLNQVGWIDNFAEAMVTRVFNDLGTTQDKGLVVYLNGVQGDRPKIALAQANNEMNSSKTFGLIYDDILDMQDGQVITEGLLSGLDTDIVGWNEGDALWLSPTVAGGYTNVKPSAPNHAVFIGTLVRKHQTQGSVQVKIQNGYELQELHNVSIPTTPSNNDVLTYNSSTGLWEAQAAGAGSAKYVRGFGFSGATIPNGSTGLPIVITSNATITKVKAYGLSVSGIWQFTLSKNGTSFHTISISSSAVVSDVISEAISQNDIITCTVTAGTTGTDFSITLEAN